MFGECFLTLVIGQPLSWCSLLIGRSYGKRKAQLQLCRNASKYNKTKNKCQEHAKMSKDKKIPPNGSYCFFIGRQLVSDFYWVQLYYVNSPNEGEGR